MELITLDKVKELSNKLDVLMNEPLLSSIEYEDMIQTIGQLEAKVELDKVAYPDGDKIITLCKMMIFKLMLKVTEVLENIHFGNVLKLQ